MCSHEMTDHLDPEATVALLAGSTEAMQDRIDRIVRDNAVVLFMKGTPAEPQCGFSAAMAKLLGRYDVPMHTVDVLSDAALRVGVKLYSDWPTLPQLFVDSRFIGGFDIVRAMHADGKLAALLAPYRRTANAA